MTMVRESRVGGRRENEVTDDRAVVLSVLSEELAERLGKHPLPPRTILPMPQPPSQGRRLVRGGLVLVIGVGAALVLAGAPWKYVERNGAPLKGTAEELVTVPLAPIAAATAQAASVPVDAPAVVRTEPPPVASVAPMPPVQHRDQATAAPAAPAAPSAERELTWMEVHELQVRLRALQFDPGPLDGVKGPLTSAAVRRFQEARGQRVTGDVSLGILIQLREVSGRAD